LINRSTKILHKHDHWHLSQNAELECGNTIWGPCILHHQSVKVYIVENVQSIFVATRLLPSIRHISCEQRLCMLNLNNTCGYMEIWSMFMGSFTTCLTWPIFHIRYSSMQELGVIHPNYSNNKLIATKRYQGKSGSNKLLEPLTCRSSHCTYPKPIQVEIWLFLLKYDIWAFIFLLSCILRSGIYSPGAYLLFLYSNNNK